MLGVDVAVVAAIIAAAVSLIVFAGDRYVAHLTRKRQRASEALSEALLWIEIPYRIARRVNDEPATLAALSSTLHHLQERHVFNRAWLRVEVPEAYKAYCDLIDEVGGKCAPHLADAWSRPPTTTPAGMNLGALYAVDVEEKAKHFVDAARTALRPRWKLLP